MRTVLLKQVFAIQSDYAIGKAVDAAEALVSELETGRAYAKVRRGWRISQAHQPDLAFRLRAWWIKRVPCMLSRRYPALDAASIATCAGGCPVVQPWLHAQVLSGRACTHLAWANRVHSSAYPAASASHRVP